MKLVCSDEGDSIEFWEDCPLSDYPMSKPYCYDDHECVEYRTDSDCKEDIIVCWHMFLVLFFKDVREVTISL